MRIGTNKYIKCNIPLITLIRYHLALPFTISIVGFQFTVPTSKLDGCYICILLYSVDHYYFYSIHLMWHEPKNILTEDNKNWNELNEDD